MYADRNRAPTRFSPAGLAAAAGINAAMIGALLFAAPDLVPRLRPDPPITIIDVTGPPPPEPAPEPPAAKTIDTPRPLPPIDLPPPTVPPAPDAGWVAPDPGPITGTESSGTAGGTGTGVTVDPPAPPPPVILGPQVDPRYARDLQPPYPPAEQRAGRDGRVTLRVLVGPDGRVQQVERVSATSDDFFRAAQSQALKRWRFRPGTRDGVAEAAWRTMTVTFVLNDL